MKKTTTLLALASMAIASCASGTSDAGTSVDPTTTNPGSTSTTILGSDQSTTTVKPPPRAPNIDLNSLPDWFQNEDAAPQNLIETIADELSADYVGSMAVEWPTSGLGCSSSGSFDLQVITPGYVIFFQNADEQLIRIHSSQSGSWRECDLARPLGGIPSLHS